MDYTAARRERGDKMQIDKETPDNGINIKFGADRTASSKKGEYRLVSQNSVNGEKKRLNGTTKRGRLIFSFYTCTRKTMLRYTGEIQKKSTKKCIYMRGSGERERAGTMAHCFDWHTLFFTSISLV